MPVRFISPSLGGYTGPLKAHEFEIGGAYRFLSAHQWFLGSDELARSQPVFIDINSADADVSYGVTDRLSLTLTVPFAHGSHSHISADGKRHVSRVAGLGDITLTGNLWLWNPATHPDGNISVGLGLKAPSGSNRTPGDAYLADGSVIASLVDQSIQLGDSGLGVILQAQAYRRLFGRTAAYGYGWYLMSPRDQMNAPSPIPGVRWSVPDVYSIRGGMSHALSPRRGVSVSFGIRTDGIPVHDAVGGSDGFRRPGYTLYLDPGLVISRRSGTWSLNIPIRAHENFKRSVADLQYANPGGGDLARYLILVGYTRRFGGAREEGSH